MDILLNPRAIVSNEMKFSSGNDFHKAYKQAGCRL